MRIKFNLVICSLLILIIAVLSLNFVTAGCGTCTSTCLADGTTVRGGGSCPTCSACYCGGGQVIYQDCNTTGGCPGRQSKTSYQYGTGGGICAWPTDWTACVAVKNCTGKTCGDDGCGNSCGTCSSGYTCNASGQCLAPCVPTCTGKVCGDNGCGGSCGTCPSGKSCNATRQCVTQCIPSCAGKTCGDDGCGGSCGVCTCTGGDSQLILRLSSATNAHGEIYSSTSYNTIVCYDSLFGATYTGANPHTCSGTNSLFLLASNTNAHAEIPTLSTPPNYNVNVCYGNLVCTPRDTCNSDERLVVSLSGNTNAHLSSTSSYPIKICCKTSGTAPPSGRYWANMQGNSITHSELGDTVQMMWRNTGLSAGTSASFEIYEDDILADDAIRTDTNAITTTVNSNGDAIALWTITQTDLDKTSDYSSFYFRAGNENSGNLEISTTIRNSPPVIEITSPLQTQFFKKNTPVSFNYTIYDEDDAITGVISFGDSQTQQISSAGTYSTQHSYSSSGIKSASITITDSRGLSATGYIDVFIIQQYLNIFLVISTPEEGEQLATKDVFLDALDTIAIYCSLEEISSCTIANPSSLTFSWNFSDGSIGNGNQLTKTFSSSGAQSATLTVKFSNSSLNGQASKIRNFFIGGCGEEMSPGQCSIDGTSYCTEAEELLNTYESEEACAGFDQEAGTEDDCCPAGSVCTEDGCSIGDEMCMFLTQCGSYFNEEECDVDPCGVGGFGIGTDVCNSNILGYYVGNCSCIWEEDNCSLAYSAMNPATFEPSFSCSKSFTETECIDDKKTVKWTATPIGTSLSQEELQALGCTSSEDIYPCGESTIKFDFSSNISIFVLLSLLVIFYIFRIKYSKLMK